MLGEKLYEWTGKVQGQRVLPADAEGPRMEITFAGPFQGHGRLASYKGIGNASYIAVARPDGSFYGEGQGIVMSEKQETIALKGFGIGAIKDGKFSYRGALTFQTTSSTLLWLNKVVGVHEFEQDLSTQEVRFICFIWQ